MTFQSLLPDNVSAYTYDVIILLSDIIIDEAVTNSKALLAYVRIWAAQNNLVIIMPKCAAVVILPYIKKKTSIVCRFRLGKSVLNDMKEMHVLRVTLKSDLK